MIVEYGTKEDISSWMKLVNLVSWNFPGLETEEKLGEHENTVLRFMSEGRALCVKEENVVVGVLLFSKKHNMICCLAVAPDFRKHGIASALLSKAIEMLDRTKDITVSTFRENDPKGIAPRKLYKSFGFVEGELIEEFGYPNQQFILSAI
ncbi:MAG: GNAT family N-acetyltransferase [Lachnospiraceae bacterium]|nr:GNAT family N-acetyltransferase [Lachnospiraceae bacterium]